MRIALVCGHYMPELGYQEVYLSRALARAGHDVTVFTSSVPSPNGSSAGLTRYQSGVSVAGPGLTIHRLPHFVRSGAKIVARGLLTQIQRYDPDVIVLIGVAKLFGVEVLLKRDRFRARMVSIFGDSAGYLPRGSIVRKLQAHFYRFTFRLIKLPAYRHAVRVSDRIVLNLPETKGLVKGMLSASLHSTFEEKAVSLRLGYDAKEFFFSEDERRSMRRDLRLADDAVLLATATRITATKRIDSLIDLGARLSAEGLPVHYALVGFMGDDLELQLRDRIEKSGVAGIFQCYPLLKHEEIRKIYAAADVGVWIRPAISIQEAMGTGLQVVLPDLPSVSHLIRESAAGSYFKSESDLEVVVREAVRELQGLSESARLSLRRRRESANYEYLAYESIAGGIVNFD